MDEEWRPVVEWEGLYEVSSLGRVRSVDRVLQDGRKWRGRILSSPKGRSGYPEVSLLVGVRKTRRVQVHRIVCRAFHGEPSEDRPFALHRDDVGTNNKASNLYWGSPRDNQLDRVRNGNHYTSMTHCRRGHELSPDNVYRQPSKPTVRYCRSCRKMRHVKWYSRAKEGRESGALE